MLINVIVIIDHYGRLRHLPLRLELDDQCGIKRRGAVKL